MLCKVNLSRRDGALATTKRDGNGVNRYWDLCALLSALPKRILPQGQRSANPLAGRARQSVDFPLQAKLFVPN